MEESEEPLHAAVREFKEETGFDWDTDVPMMALTPVRQANGKIVHAWAFEGNFDADKARSNSFLLEWPPGSGRQQEFPEIDRAAWFPLSEARQKVHAGQEPLFLELERLLLGGTRDQ
jgi:predicted NUDIX family NTP pyrophosphohydrolase